MRNSNPPTSYGSEHDFNFIYLFGSLSRNELLEATEEEFLAAVRDMTRLHGRKHVVDAMLTDSFAGSSQLSDDSVENELPNDTDSDSSEDSIDEDDDSDDDSERNSVENVPQVNDERIFLHEPIVHDHIHCPPFKDLSDTFCGIPCGVCDCDDFCFALCLQENNYQFLKDCFYKINFDDQLLLAEGSMDEPRRKPNNELRKYLYKKFFVSLDFGVLEKGERKRLPNCAVAKIRQMCPSETGYYMGFKEH